VIATDAKLAILLPAVEGVDRVAVDTEADSLHCYFEKLCLVQLSFAGEDYLVDPLAPLDFAPLCAALGEKEIVLQGADFDLRLLRRAWNFAPRKVFDTVVAARLLGIREFSLAALVQRFFDVTLAKGSQKANWARRPLPPVMEEYAMNDTRYLLPLAGKLEEELRARGRFEWFEQSCLRGMEQAAVERVRDPEEAWRIAGSGRIAGKPAAILRALWHWREREAQQADRPAFHILQNSQLLFATESFAAGEVPDFRHFSERRRRTFRAAGDGAARSPESEWPQPKLRKGVRPTREVEKRAEDLKRRRDAASAELDLEPSFVASRSALEMIASDESRSGAILAAWQREILGLNGAAA
jgi:ribonuclease D